MRLISGRFRMIFRPRGNTENRTATGEMCELQYNKVEICGVNTSKLPVLTAKEKRELFEKIKQGDAEARQKFIYGNLRLVLSILKRFNNRNENIDDRE